MQNYWEALVNQDISLFAHTNWACNWTCIVQCSDESHAIMIYCTFTHFKLVYTWLWIEISKDSHEAGKYYLSCKQPVILLTSFQFPQDWTIPCTSLGPFQTLHGVQQAPAPQVWLMLVGYLSTLSWELRNPRPGQVWACIKLAWIQKPCLLRESWRNLCQGSPKGIVSCPGTS